jgi:hypothetical protein
VSVDWHAWFNTLSILACCVTLLVLGVDIRWNRRRIETLEKLIHRRDKKDADDAERLYRSRLGV